MRENPPWRRLTGLALASLLTFAPAAARADRPDAADLDAFRRDPQCGSKAALDALGEFFQAQGETVVAAGRTAGKVLEAAGKAAPAVAEAARARTELGKIAGQVAKEGPDAARQAAALADAIGDLETDANAMAALDRSGFTADGGALETSVGTFAAGCAGCASAMAAAVTELGAGSPAAAGGAGAAGLAAGPCRQALEDPSRINDSFARIRKFVVATVTLSQSIRKSARDLGAAGDALTNLGHELGQDSRPALHRIEDGLNRSIDAINAAGRTYDGEVAPRVAKLGPSLLQQLADNTDRLMACYGKLQDIAGRRTRHPAPIRFDGSLEVPGGLDARTADREDPPRIRATRGDA